MGHMFNMPFKRHKKKKKELFLIDCKSLICVMEIINQTCDAFTSRVHTNKNKLIYKHQSKRSRGDLF